MTQLERLRKERGLDQTQLATRAGVAQSTVSRAESGGKLTADTALALAGALKVSVEELLLRPRRKARRASPPTPADDAVSLEHDAPSAPAPAVA
jgi:transcriptional regulator with XRE-family HTH domain